MQNTVTNTKKEANSIRINGQEYNALTGAPVGPKPRRTVDGFTGYVPKVALAAPRPATPLQPLEKSAAIPVMDIARTPAPHHKRAAQSGKTLMRTAVKKPDPSLKRTTKPNVPVKRQSAKTPAIVKKSLAHAVDDGRASRSSVVAKSPAIKRFGGFAKSALPSPKPEVAAKVAANAAPAPKPTIFEKAIEAAKSHEQPAPKIKKSRSNVYATTVMAAVLLGGFITYQNLTNIKLQYASSRAGFQAELPGKRPAGFSVANLSYRAGAVDLRYASNSDNRSFLVSQKASSWDSQALRETYLSSVKGDGYQTVESGGRTIYIYGDGNATWVNGGIWCQIESTGTLSERQLVDLATSM